MSDNTSGGVYCSVCHKRRPASHFDDRPDHAAGGPKFTLAERREAAEMGEDLDGYSSTPRPRRPRSTPPASDAGEGEGTGAGGGWIAAGIGGAILVGLGYLAWLGRNASGDA